MEPWPPAEKACDPRSPFWQHGYRYWGFFNEHISYYMDLAARVLAKKGDIAGAISEYERLFKIPFTYKSAYFKHPLHHYRLGLLYEKAGEIEKAKAQYKRFLGLWKDADPGLPKHVEDHAGARLAGLGK